MKQHKFITKSPKRYKFFLGNCNLVIINLNHYDKSKNLEEFRFFKIYSEMMDSHLSCQILRREWLKHKLICLHYLIALLHCFDFLVQAVCSFSCKTSC